MKKKKIIKLNTPFQCLSAGVISGILSVIAVIAVFSTVIVNYDISFEMIKYCWIIVSVIAGFISGAVCGRFVKSKAILWGTLSSLIVLVFSFILILSFNGFVVSLFVLIMIPVFIISGASGGVIAANLR